MKFGLLFLIGSLLPVCLIAPRGGYMLYIPLMGWALYAACLFQWIGNRLVGLAHLRPRATLAVEIVGVSVAALLIMHLHAASLAPHSSYWQGEQKNIRRVIERLLVVHPRLTRGSSLLLLDDPLPSGFGLLFLTDLAYGDPSLQVDRLKMLRTPPVGDELIRYDHVLAGGWDLHDVRSPSDSRMPVEIRFQPRVLSSSGSYLVEIPEYAGQTVDLAVRTMSGSRSERQIVRNCALDSQGRAALPVPNGLSRATIQARWVRPRGGEWISASGAMEIR